MHDIQHRQHSGKTTLLYNSYKILCVVGKGGGGGGCGSRKWKSECKGNDIQLLYQHSILLKHRLNYSLGGGELALMGYRSSGNFHQKIFITVYKVYTLLR